MTPSLKINLPKTHIPKPDDQKHHPPSTDFLTGNWHVTHSSLPLWKNKRNVNITYTPLPNTPKLDDLVQYQTLTSDKINSVHGVDTPSPGNPGAWDWRGKGWLVIASSHWECLGFGTVDSDGDTGDEGGNQWVVTYFAKTLFTPAGIDIYSREKGGLPASTVEEILDALRRFGVEKITRLVDNVFQIPQN